jgi:glycerophosphoryl diester phosphodiesterase
MWCPDFKDVTLELVQEAHDLGLLVCPWTVNEIKDFENMVSAGVDGIITDYPNRAQNVLNAFGMNW